MNISLPCLLRSRCAGDLSYILRLTTAASFILLVSVSHHAETCAAAAIIDQQQLQTSAGWGFGFGLNLGEQEVVAGVAGKLEGFDFWLNDTANLSSVLVDVSVKLGAVGSGTLVFQDTISYASEDLGAFFFVDTSAADVVLTPGNRFVLGVFPRAGLTLGGQTGNPYGAGGFFFNSLGGSDYDMAFRTHVSVVPESSAFAIALTSLACGGFSIWQRRKHRRVGRAFITTASLALVAACRITSPAHAVTIDMVTVGNPGNTNDTTGFGAVNYEYRIGKYEVTIGQYVEFLNAAAVTDPYGLYSVNMGGTMVGGVQRSGEPGSYTYGVVNNRGNRPIVDVTWFSAARFANWLHNGQGSGDTETGAYTLNGAISGTAPSKNPGAQFYIPTENEWYKAAYYSAALNSGSGGYWAYATQSNTAPGNTIGPEVNHANYKANGVFSVTQSGAIDTNQNYLTDVGAFTSSASYYGTFDQSGNLYEWNDLTGLPDPIRSQRGGSWGNFVATALSSAEASAAWADGSSSNVGFRLASPVTVPEPSTYAMALAGIACGGSSMWRRRKRNRLSCSPIIAASLPLVTAVIVTAGLIGGIAREAVGASMVLVNNGSQILRFDGTIGASLGNVLVDYGGGSIGGYTFGPDRNIYVSDFSGFRIDRFNGSTGVFMNTFATGTLSSPYQPLFGPDGNLYLGQSTGLITEYNGATGQYLGIFISPPAGAFDFGGMTFRGNSLYVSYLGQSGSLYRYDAATGSNAQLVYGNFSSNGPRAPVFDNAGTMYVPDWQTNKIFKFSETTLALTGTITTAFGIVPTSLAFDESGALLVLSDNFSQSQINRYNPATGTFIDTLVAPGTGGMGRASDMLFIVPEPTTSCMALAGLASGGYSMWRRRKHRRVGRSFITTASLALVVAFLAINPAHAVTIDMVTVGDPGNANDSTGYGAVNDEYRIGKYEVTIQQYTDFLNAVASTDTYLLYNTSMASNLLIAGISRSGTGGGYTYSVIGSSGNKPITYVSWFDAARFANWMQNGQGSGSTETGAYTLSGATSGNAVAVNPGATFYIPTENEWYKAAYYSPVLNSGSGGSYTYAMQSNTVPGNVVGGAANQANYFNGVYSVTQSGNYSTSQNYLSDAGAFSNSASYYGTFDQSGNVFEWNDRTGAAGPTRALRGGTWGNNAFDLSSSSRYDGYAPATDGQDIGFRLASPVAVPEPSTWVMGLAGIACAGWGAWRRRQKHGRRGLPQPATASLGLVVLLLAYGSPARAVTINFIVPLPEGQVYAAEDLPYSESGYVFTDVFGSTGHVITIDAEWQSDSYMALGDWDPTSVTSRILVAQEANASFSLASVNYLHTGPGRLQFLSSKGGTLLTPESSSSGTLNFRADPLWHDITNFTITGIAGDPGAYGEFYLQDEALISSMELVPEPSTYAMALAGLSCGGFTMFRRRIRA